MFDGTSVYMAFRDHEHRYRNGQPNAGWAIDNDTLTEVRLSRCNWVAVWVRDTGDIYLAPRESFTTPGISYQIDWSRHTGAAGQRGSVQRVLRFKDDADNDNFRVLTGTHKVR